MQRSEIFLRPHHGLCIGFFEGKGYSNEFTANMSAVIEKLQNTDPHVTLTCGFDVICSSCPNALSEACVTEEKVQRYDSAVLSLIGAHEGDNMAWSQFFSAVRRNIVLNGRLGDVCGDCKWQYICSRNEQFDL